MTIGRRLRPQLCDQPQNLLEHLPGNGDLGHLEGNAAAMADDLGADLDQPLLQARQRPVLDRLGRRQRAKKVAKVFDINPFPERVRELKTWISEDAGPEASIDALMSVIAYFRIANARAKEMLGQVEAAVASWREEGRALGMTKNELEQFVDAFEHGERAAARKLSA